MIRASGTVQVGEFAYEFECTATKEWTDNPPPENDDCEGEKNFLPTDCPFNEIVNVSDAGNETNEPETECAQVFPTRRHSRSVWYGFLANSSEPIPVIISTGGSNYDTVVQVYEADFADKCNFSKFVPIACNDDVVPFITDTSLVDFIAEPGKFYKIKVSEKGNSPTAPNPMLNFFIDCQFEFTLTQASNENALNAIHTVTATVTRNGQPVVGEDVEFSIFFGPNSTFISPSVDQTDANGEAFFPYQHMAGTTVGTDTIEARLSVDGSTIIRSIEKAWVDVECELVPDTAINASGTDHTVVACVTKRGPEDTFAKVPLDGQAVNFDVTQGPNMGQSGTEVTDAAGKAPFTYMSNGTDGSDTIVATTLFGAAIIACTATKEWSAMTPENDNCANEVDVTDASCPFTVTGLAVSKGTSEPNEPPMDSSCAGTSTLGVKSVWYGFKNSSNLPKDVQISTDGAGTNYDTVIQVYLITREDHCDKLHPLFCANDPGLGEILIFVAEPGACYKIKVARFGSFTGGTDEVLDFSIECQDVDVVCALEPQFAVKSIVESTHTVTLTLSQNSNPAMNVPVTFDIADGPNEFDLGLDTTTDANGQATYTYIGSVVSGTDIIVVSGVVGGFEFSCTAKKRWVEIECSLHPEEGFNAIGTEHSVIASVTIDGMTAPAGIPINFSVFGVNSGQSQTVPTDAFGMALFAYTSNNQSGTDTIVAMGNFMGVEFSCEAEKTWSDISCTLLPPNAINTAGEVHTLTATVLRNGLPVENEDVSFLVDRLDGAATLASRNTDANGQAVYSFNHIGKSAFYEIEAGGVLDGVDYLCTADKEYQSPICTLEPLNATNTVGENHTLTATVMLGGNPVPGVDVIFKGLQGTFAGAQFDNVTTNAAGVAMTTYTSSTPGTDINEAFGFVGGALFSCRARKNWVEGAGTPTPTATDTPMITPTASSTQSGVTPTATGTPQSVRARELIDALNNQQGSLDLFQIVMDWFRNVGK